MNLYFQDESRFGRFTRNGKALTARSVQPVCPFQQEFRNLCLFGAFSPINGDSFVLEMPWCNADCFQAFLDAFARRCPDELKIMLLDKGAFHKASRLKIPDNIVLLFLPPCSPELNPAEKIWARFKRAYENKLCKTLDDVGAFITTTLLALTTDIVISTCRFANIFDGLDRTI